MRLADIDLSNPDLFAAGPPHEAFRVLRREAPLFWNGNGESVQFCLVDFRHGNPRVGLNCLSQEGFG